MDGLSDVDILVAIAESYEIRRNYEDEEAWDLILETYQLLHPDENVTLDGVKVAYYIAVIGSAGDNGGNDH